MGAIREITVPDIGDFKDVEVIEILVKPGDRVEKEGSLVTLESDKATMEIPAPEAGTVRELRVKLGDKVSEGSPILLLEASEQAAAAAGAPSAPAGAGALAKPAEPGPSAREPDRAAAPAGLGEPDAFATSGASSELAEVPPLIPRTGPVPYEPMPEPAAFKSHASPSVRKFARELGVDLGPVKGKGPKGRILREDVQAFVKGVMKGAPAAATGAPAAAAP
ncbi:MAG: E3 binding domain-containing protein, partial [Betaproteobacteria bacterium]|nr:E3 binding domain-containing protein [Betaproteobacteria bacterium]